MPDDDLVPLTQRLSFASKGPGKCVSEHGHGVLETDAVLLDVRPGFGLIPFKERRHYLPPFLGLLFQVWLRLDDVGVPALPQPTALSGDKASDIADDRTRVGRA